MLKFVEIFRAIWSRWLTQPIRIRYVTDVRLNRYLGYMTLLFSYYTFFMQFTINELSFGKY